MYEICIFIIYFHALLANSLLTVNCITIYQNLLSLILLIYYTLTINAIKFIDFLTYFRR